ncbi:hypothetical protein [Photobacterium leiognathi]|uniref:hypothetical protein n=1 Tax=Photobacterium leiognathi TaxID=553611 RepID=UPI0027389B1B|nr:hypothetical protein [Photobacterium leiognathi]
MGKEKPQGHVAINLGALCELRSRETHAPNITIINRILIGEFMSYSLINQIKNIADWASKESGTSYDDYIRLFSERADKAFKKHPRRNTAIYLAERYGYTPKKLR